MRHLLHKAICWYLRRCGGAFHCYEYGQNGRYVKLMTDAQYSASERMERALRDILIAHGSYGDGSNLDKLTRDRCLVALTPHDGAELR
jgi:hypothetical protein